jgi:hypothetical protein
MMAETAPQPERQMRTQGTPEQGVRYAILLAAVAHMLLRDRRFHTVVVMRVIGAVALASVVKNNEARPVRRFVSWYNRLGGGRALARVHSLTHEELARAGQALEQGKGS